MQNKLPICGLNKTTLLDYPTHVASTVFLGGCNFRCPFCHNGELVLSPTEYIAYSEADILAHLAKRKGILSGVCISGGEPTLYPALKDFMQKIKMLGYQIKLDTNGSKPAFLAELIHAGLVDYIAMDIKADEAAYPEAIGLCTLKKEQSAFENSSTLLSSIHESIHLIRTSGVAYEFRTTVVKGLHNEATFYKIGEWLHGSGAYFLQNYVKSEHVINPVFSSFSKAELEVFAEICRPHFASVIIRGVD
jgi:pyruvate formate lyase activating enzyme